MTKLSPTILLALVPILGIVTANRASAQDSPEFRRIVQAKGFARVSPFQGLRRTTAGIEVQVDDDTWFELISIDKVSVPQLLDGAREHCGRRAWERIVEDIVEVLDVIGARPGDTVDLSLRDLNTGKPVRKNGVALTAEKRRCARHMARGHGSGPRVARTGVSTELKRAAWQADLAQLARILDSRFSYRRLGRVDLESALAAARERLGPGSVTRERLGQEVARVIARFHDGHAGLLGDVNEPGYLPFLVGAADGKLVAFRPDRTGFLDPERPYLVALDGKNIDDWIEAAGKFVNQGSPQYVEERSRRMLRWAQFLRRRLGLETSDRLEVTLDGRAGERVVTLRISSRRPIYGVWPRTSNRVLKGNIGYLRIPSMSREPAFLDRLDECMRVYRDTRGLIIDVRGNGGGSRAALRRLFPYFMRPGEKAHVANVAAYRLTPGAEDPHRTEGYLANRWLYPASWPKWSDAARDAIANCARRFRPEWRPPTRAFSDWHYFVLERAANPEASYYGPPVAILMDPVCFSATDVFLGAFKGRRGVTLIGAPSGGGSGRSARYRLDNSGLRFQLSTMASFRPNGRLYDGNGIDPDVRVDPVATDWIGQTDAVLDAAVELVRKEATKSKR